MHTTQDSEFVLCRTDTRFFSSHYSLLLISPSPLPLFPLFLPLEPSALFPLSSLGGIMRNVLSPVLSGGCVITCSGFDPLLFWWELCTRNYGKMSMSVFYFEDVQFDFFQTYHPSSVFLSLFLFLFLSLYLSIFLFTFLSPFYWERINNNTCILSCHHTAVTSRRDVLSAPSACHGPVPQIVPSPPHSPSHSNSQSHLGYSPVGERVQLTVLW